MARESALGRRVKRYVTTGQLVPDALVVQVMVSRLAGRVAAKGFVLDGFPRTRVQAEGLDHVLKRRQQSLDGAIYLTSPQPLLVRRLSGRRVCVKCGANYHLRTMRPRRPGRCDHCGSVLMTRKDDQPATIRTRLTVDHKAAAPLLRYYRRQKLLYSVDGRGRIDTVFVRALKLFRREGWVR